MKNDHTPNEVGTLIENLRGEFRVVSEAVLPLREDMVDVKSRLSAVEFEVKDVVRVAIPSMYECKTR